MATFREEAAAELARLKAEPLIRAVNFHNTPRSREAEFRGQLEAWSRSFSPVNEAELDGYLRTGVWGKRKPGLIVAIYNGYRNGYDVMRPLLEQYGLVGWFFVPTLFVSEPAAGQREFVRSRTLKVIPGEYADGRYALSWEEIRAMDGRHVIASHTRNHSELVLDDAGYVRNETVGPQEDFRARLGHPVRAFASLGGAAYGESALADRFIDEAGYAFLFSNYRIQRLRGLGRH